MKDLIVLFLRQIRLPRMRWLNRTVDKIKKTLTKGSIQIDGVTEVEITTSGIQGPIYMWTLNSVNEIVSSNYLSDSFKIQVLSDWLTSKSLSPEARLRINEFLQETQT